MRRLLLAGLTIALLAAGVWWLPHRNPTSDATTTTATSSTSSTSTSTDVAGTPAVATPAAATAGAGGSSTSTTLDQGVVTIPHPPAPTVAGQLSADTEDDETSQDLRDVAAGWALERYRATWDPAALPRGALLAAWSHDGTLVAAAAAGPPHVDTAAHETVSAVVADTVDLGDGWWQTRLAVKTTREGHIGVATTTATVTVHITAGLVDADTDLPLA